MSSLLRSTVSHRLTRTLRAVIPLLLLAALVSHLGTSPFERSLHVLTAGPITVALLLGVVTTTAQALRWRTVAAGYGAADGLTRTRAVAECYRSALLNAVLPGGVLGDAIRAWRLRPSRERGLRSSAQAVIGERVAGTVLLLVAVAAVLLPLEPMMSAMALAGAAGAAVVAAPTLKRLTRSGQAAVWGWSLLSLISLVTKFGVAAAALGTVSGITDVVTLALIVLAGMSIPIGVGGFGPREAVAAVAFAAVGLSADAGVATAAAYGMLAAVSALPGVLVMLFDLWRDGRANAADAADAADSADTVTAELVEIHPELIHPELVHAGPVHAGPVHAGPVHPVLVRQNHGILGDVVRIDLVGKAKRDRLAIDAQSRSQIEFEDVFAELEPARQSA
ncbi:MAG TPA: lysylphosphatidylglycerol synthase domain-containing protein [Kineosporiaceae bacterium]|nr:lysylphosphatidylglycerol synthase domain-containing protein [Kineosporiaceae bacterium]